MKQETDVAAVILLPLTKYKGKEANHLFSLQLGSLAHGITVLQPEEGKDEAFEKLRTYIILNVIIVYCCCIWTVTASRNILYAKIWLYVNVQPSLLP